MRRLFRSCMLVAVVGLALFAVPAAASAVSTLTGESLAGGTTAANGCSTTTYSSSGTATGPYPGTFTETGTLSPSTTGFSATFTITSGTTTITGSKSGTVGAGGVDGGFICAGSGVSATLTGVPYTATINTPSGSFHDEGTSSATVDVTDAPKGDTVSESFTSSLSQPVPVAPTSEDQCKNNGWKNFPQFKNQGQCVSFVQSHRPS